MNIGIGVGVGFQQGVGSFVQIPETPPETTGIVQDSFDRADSATLLGVADSGQTWQPLSGTWGISGNKSYEVTNGGGDKFSVIDSTVSNCTIECEILWRTGGIIGLLCRAIDVNNLIFTFIQSGNMTLAKKVGGAYTSLGIYSFTPVDGTTYKVKIVLSGNNITVYLDDVSRITTNVTEHVTNTKHGLFKNSASNNQRFDNFYIN